MEERERRARGRTTWKAASRERSKGETQGPVGVREERAAPRVREGTGGGEGEGGGGNEGWRVGEVDGEQEGEGEKGSESERDW